MATSEIDKLERRYAENPHGLTFAPLAEVHRKNGDVTRALELLRIGLELHPNYIPASIVLGRCHQDMGDLPAAAEAFAHVLRLDDENVIALKSLADINERQDCLEDAERWLRRLVLVDRSNDEARQQLERVESAREKLARSAPATPASGTARVEKLPPQQELPHEIDVVKAKPAPPPALAAAEVRTAPAEVPPLDLTDDLKNEKTVEAVLEPSALREPEPPAAADAGRLPGLETAEFEPPKSAALEPLGLEIETESDVVLNSSGASEFTVPDASQDLAALAAKYNASRPRTPGRRASDRAAAEAREAAAKASEAAAPQVPAAAAISELPAAPPAPPAPPPKPYSVRHTSGQSIGAFFQALLVARPPAESGAGQPAPSETSRPEQDSNGSPGAGAETATPAASAAGSSKDDLVSFDDFFGSAGGRSVTASGEPGKDDLDQFQTWLQNLKR
jgi:tetratricopeptide (TPR) repeat protein